MTLSIGWMSFIFAFIYFAEFFENLHQSCEIQMSGANVNDQHRIPKAKPISISNKKNK